MPSSATEASAITREQSDLLGKRGEVGSGLLRRRRVLALEFGLALVEDQALEVVLLLDLALALPGDTGSK